LKPIRNSGIDVGSQSAPASYPIGRDAAGEVGQPEDLLVELRILPAAAFCRPACTTRYGRKTT